MPSVDAAGIPQATRRIAGRASTALVRDTTSTIRAAGFTIDDLDRFTFKPSAALPGSAHVIGRAHRN